MEHIDIGLKWGLKKAKLGNKIISPQEAISRLVNDGDLVGAVGSGGYHPSALLMELARQRKRDLSICSIGAMESVDTLVGLGMVKQLEFGYAGTSGGGLPPNLRRSLEKGIPHRVQVEDYSNLAMTLRFFAGALELPFIPIRSLKGSDIVTYKGWRGEKKLAGMKSPFTGEETTVLPPCVPDVTIIHAHQADSDGNVQRWGMIGADDWAAYAAKKLIVSVERIVDNSLIRKDPSRTLLPGFVVDAVVELPWGAHPNPVPGFYDMDLEFFRLYPKAAKEREGFLKFVEEWIDGTTDHQGYLDKLGRERLEKLRVKEPALSVPVDYGY